MDRTRVVKEVEILKELKEKNIGCVPTLIDAGIVEVPVGYAERIQEVKAVRSKKDCTENIRRCLIKEAEKVKGVKKAEGNEELKVILGTEIRDHYRIVMQPFGERFDDFDSLSELLSATFDILKSEIFISRNRLNAHIICS